MITASIPLIFAVLGAWAGGSLWPSQYLKGFWTNAPEIALAALCGVLWGYCFRDVLDLQFVSGFIYNGQLITTKVNDEYIFGSLVALWVYLWFQSGHANALSWGQNANPKRKNTLTPVVEFIYRGGFGRIYSAVFFSVKGFLLSLPFGGLGAIYWPLAYDIGVWLEKKTGKNMHYISELLSCFFLGCNVLLVYKLMS